MKLSSLLPRIEDRLWKNINSLEFVFNCLDKVIQSFLEHNYKDFDALVGENACQIRALKISLLASTPAVHSTVCSEMNGLKDGISLAKVSIQSFRLSSIQKKHDNATFSDLIASTDIVLSDNVVYLYHCFILTVTKLQLSTDLVNPMEKCRELLLKTIFPDVTSNMCKFAVKASRKIVAALSVKFMQSQAAVLNNSTLLHVFHTDKYLYQHAYKPCLPCYSTFLAVFQSALFHEIPLLIKVHFISVDFSGANAVVGGESLFLDVNSNPDGVTDFVQVEPTDKDMQRMCIVVSGNCIDSHENLLSAQEWTEKMKNIGYLNAMLANGAEHRQYPSVQEAYRVQDLMDGTFAFHRDLARTVGFCVDNPATFLGKHIYADKLANVFHLL
jgi:hypothetical protein